MELPRVGGWAQAFCILSCWGRRDPAASLVMTKASVGGTLWAGGIPRSTIS